MTDHLYVVKKLVDRLHLQDHNENDRSRRYSNSRRRSSQNRSRSSDSLSTLLRPYMTPVFALTSVQRRHALSSFSDPTLAAVDFRSADGLLSPNLRGQSGSFSSTVSGAFSSPRSSTANDDIFSSPEDCVTSSNDVKVKSNSGSSGFAEFAMTFPRSSTGTAKSDLSAPRHRSNSGRRKVSASKSMPLSPSERSSVQVTTKYHNIQLQLDKLKSELLAMRKIDQELAKSFLTIYAEIQSIKIARSCRKYCELLDDAYFDAEMADEVPDMCDAAPKSINKVLMKKGVTSFNISSRRFSCS